MKQLTLAGHPIHPQIIPFPLGLLPFSAVMDCMYLATGKRRYADAAYYSLVGGVLGAAAAAATGIPDYLTIESGGPMKRSANTHGILNATIVAVETVNLSMRKRRRSGILPATLGIIGALGTFISQWYGGKLVYNMGMRVKPVRKPEHDQLRVPGDRAMERGLNRFEELMPAGGPAETVS
ncbi:MAG TPA: DUF2231 domain-containing protein [Tepidisphaeraceae bacterium]|nr:DUF2231 domain-containing protein [Tepidisphaeraceae bacterium]